MTGAASSHRELKAHSLPNALRSTRAAQTLRYGLDPEGYFAAAQRRLGDVFTARVLGETWVVLADPAAVKEVFALGPDEANSGEANFALRPLIGTRNLLLLDGGEHLARRKLLLPPFHGDRMRAYQTIIEEETRRTVSELPRGRRLSILPPIQSLTFSVILRCVFGVRDAERMAQLGSSLQRMLGWVTDMRRTLAYGVLGPDRLVRLPSFRRQMKAVDEAIMAELSLRRAAGDLEERQDILSMLLLARDEEGNGLSDGELRDELTTLLVAGHETTAAAIAWAIVELARHPQIQEALFEEDGDDLFDAAIVETLRLRPPAPLVLRRLREPATIGGHELPGGTTLAPCSLLVHRRPDLYPDPWAFDPSRFLNRRPIASEWFPFGGSTRRCIGAAFAQFEARVVLKGLLDKLSFEPGRRRTETLGRRGVILVPGRGGRVVVKGR